MSLIEKLKAGKRNVKIIKFPGTDQNVMLQVLSNAETQEAVFASERRFKAEDIVVDKTTLDAYQDERTTQILFRALRDPQDAKKAFAASADELRASLTKDEKDILVTELDAFQDECSPNIVKISDEEFDTLWESLKKSPETVSSFLSSAMLKRLLLYLASRPATLPTDSGSIS